MVDPNQPGDLYNLSKLTGEAACLANADPRVRIARLSNVFGHDPGSDNFLSAVLREAAATGQVLMQTSPQSAKDFIAVSDVCRALAFIAGRGAERLYNVAAGRNTTNAELGLTLEACGIRVTYATEAPTAGFPAIDTSRLRSLGFSSRRSVTEALPELLEQTKSPR